MRKTSHWLRLATIIGAAVVLLAFAACGGDDDSGGSATATHTAGSSATATEGGGSTHTSEATEPADTGDIFSQLDALTADVDQISGKVSYTNTEEDGTTSTFTFWSLPPKSRFDTTSADGSSSSYITTADSTYYCDSSSQSCISYGSGTSGGVNPFGIFFSPTTLQAYVAAADAAGVNVDTSDESINGIDASCYTWQDPSDSTNQGKLCFNSDGIVVSEEFTSSSGTFSLKATEVSTDVSDSDFEPPYPVTTLPS
jgi:outer membrane lipoprotein-sorting protein